MINPADRTFSESWHRVANLRIALRPNLKVRKQLFRGKIWHLIQDPLNNHFFRLEQPAYNLLVRLGLDRTVASVWEDQLERSPQTAPGQEEVIRLLAQLHQANLLFCELPIDSRKLFERYHQRRQREHRSKLLSLMFFRIPLIDPDPWLNSHAGLVKLLTSRGAFALWLLILFMAGKSLIDQAPLFLSEVKNLLDFDNLILLYAGLVLVKSLHEFGHTLICKRFGGEVHTIGVMLIVFAPLPYMDATSSWALRERHRRILVSCGGMLFEFFAAALAALVWANTAPGTIHSLALNMLIVASVSTLLFNANPLLRYDGYYILSDLLDIPNLQPRAISQLKYLAQRYLFALHHLSSPAGSSREAVWLTLYGLLSGLYRLVVYTAIILFMADRFLIVGLLMALFCLVVWGIMPLARLARYLLISPELTRSRPRAVLTSLIFLLVMSLLFGAIPLPHRFRAPGIVDTGNNQDISGQTAGKLEAILAPSGSHVEVGQPLLRMTNQELEIDIKLVRAQREEILLLQQQSIAFPQDATRDSLKQRLIALDNRLAELLRRQESLLITAASAGIWLAPELDQKVGSWLGRGEKLGQIVATSGYQFTAVVNQANAGSLFSAQHNAEISIRLVGSETIELKADKYTIIPYEQEQLPSAALGWQGGGEVPVTGGQLGLQTIEPFFRITAELNGSTTESLRHGHSGHIRFSLPAEPLAVQIYRKARQFVQKRYQT